MAVTFHAKHTPDAARLAIEYGAAGIIVSNHGARQLDYVPATISCLEEVRRPNPSVIQSFRVFRGVKAKSLLVLPGFPCSCLLRFSL
jgi:hypothetical protein|uniref:(S)-2-hydroxy-acid oxidase n=1 Tax=Zea mays TaxID=4577 RepID=C0PEN3_MAIZE|nr:unknown [Zea mays]